MYELHEMEKDERLSVQDISRFCEFYTDVYFEAYNEGYNKSKAESREAEAEFRRSQIEVPLDDDDVPF
jgi:hypothetical protein